MAFQNPIFNGNLYGGLTRFAMNGFAQTQRVATANAAGIKFAQAEAFNKAPTKSVLASIESATLYSDNRWTYSVKIWFPTPIGGGGITFAMRWYSLGSRPIWKSMPSGPAISLAKNSPGF